MSNNVEAKLIAVIAETYEKPVEEISLSTTLHDLDPDSISIIEMTILIEEKWPTIKISDDEMYEIIGKEAASIKDILKLVERKLAA
jgi:acyl carrier protein